MGEKNDADPGAPAEGAHLGCPDKRVLRGPSLASLLEAVFVTQVAKRGVRRTIEAHGKPIASKGTSKGPAHGLSR